MAIYSVARNRLCVWKRHLLRPEPFWLSIMYATPVCGPAPARTPGMPIMDFTWTLGVRDKPKEALGVS